MDRSHYPIPAAFILLVLSILSITCSDSSVLPHDDDATDVAVQALKLTPEERLISIYATDSIAVGERAQVRGIVAVRSAGSAAQLVPGYEVAVKRGARIFAPGELFGYRILLDPKVVAGDIHARWLSGVGAEHGLIHPFQSISNLLDAVPPIAGTEPLVVQAGSNGPLLQAGRYANVRIESGATLRLAGGVYELGSLTLGGHSRLEAVAPADLRVEGRLAAAESAFIGPSANKESVVLNVRIDVHGLNGTAGGLDETPRAAVVGPASTIAAVVSVPNGTLELGAGTQARGAFFGREVDIGMDADIEGYPGLARPNPCVRLELCKGVNLTGKITIQCESVPLPAGESCSDANSCNGEEVCNDSGRCMAGKPPVVDDGNACSLDWCDPVSGVHHQMLPDNSACSDGNDCTHGDVCAGGSCVGTVVTNGGGCSDGDDCNGIEICAQGVCEPGVPKVVDDGDPMTIDACDSATGLVSHADCLKELDLSVVTSMARAATCLYVGGAPLQHGIAGQPFDPALFDPFAQGAPFDPTKIAMLHGEAADAGGNAIAGVTIKVLEQSWAGSTITRADGVFDMAVHGGGPITVSYSKAGYLPVHRQAAPGWQEYARLPDVVMIRQAAHAMPITMNQPEIQVARGEVVADSDGIRQATVLFPASTTAVMTLPGQTTPVPLDGTTHVRITEYTVGDKGPESMPASLPATSGYTYAADLSIDEATAAGATQVDFSNPVVVYLENFIGFHTGEAVPSGYYDAGKAQWIPSDDGRVIRIESIVNGEAVVDTIGGLAGVEPLWLDSVERQKLASLYSPGQTLWRIPITHFSIFDWNWGFGPPDGATYPLDPEPSVVSAVNDPCTQSGSVIDCQNQALGEAFAIIGSPYTLHYQSDRQPGRAAFLNVPIYGNTHPDLRGIQLETSIAGDWTRHTFLNPPGVLNMAWGNRDGMGRLVQGSQPLKVNLGYVYKCKYTRGSFGASGGEDAWVSGNRAACKVTLWKTWKSAIGHFIAIHQGLGGMTLSEHHTYDALDRVLYLGDGRTVRGEALSPTISTVAGMGAAGSCVDGMGPLQTRINPSKVAVAADGTVYIADSICKKLRRILPTGEFETVASGDILGQTLSIVGDAAVGADGSVYFTDRLNSRVLKRSPEGAFELVAGKAQCLYAQSQNECGDGGPAKDAGLYDPTGIAVGPDGSIYVADSYNLRIRRIAPDGMIWTFAGNGGGCGNCTTVGENVAATDEALPEPVDVEVGPDGSVYIVDAVLLRVRRVRPDGTIVTVAGSGQAGETGDGGDALLAKFARPHGIAVAPDGTLFIADGGLNDNGRIRQVENQIIRTVAGGAPQEAGTCCGNCYCGNGGSATAANLVRPQGVAVAPDGSLYIADYRAERVYRVQPSLPGMSMKSSAIASEDGSKLYEFDAEGRHLRTLDALNGNVLFSFGYEKGKLNTITDPDGRVTTVHRHSDESLDYIQGPYGQTTSFELYASGYIKTIHSPAGTVTLEYAPDSHKEGLLTKLVDPKGNVFQFDYENDGRLKKHTDPPDAGGERLFLRDNPSGSSGFDVQVTTKTGPGTGDKIEITYQVENLPEGIERRTNILPGGLKATTEIEPNGKRTTTFPDGTTTTLIDKGDQRFGMQAPIVSSLEISTGGLTQVVDSSRTSTPLPDLTVDTLTDTTRINGRTFTKTYTATPSPKITRTSPAGRESITELDAAGRPIRLTLQSPPAHPFELYPTELSYYDVPPHKGRLMTITQGIGPDARTASFFYNGQGYVDHIEDPLGRTIAFEYDSAGRTRIKTLADGSILEFVYDANGNVEKLAPPRLPMMLLPGDDELHKFDYGPLDFLTTYTPPKIHDWLAGSTSLTYTPNRLLDATTRPVGQTIDPVYDLYGRLDYIGLPGPEVLDFSYYDFADTSQPGGKLHTITSSQDGVTLSYSYLGSLLQSVTWSGNVSGSIEWQYNNDFRVTSERVNGTDLVTFDYGDADGMLTQAGALTLNRDPQTGTLTGTTIGNLTDTYSYNKFGELTDYEVTVAGTTKYAVHYTLRDKLGRVVRKKESVNGEPEVAYEYHYDEVDQLTDVFQGDGPCDPSTCTQLAHYEYSLNGNRTLVQYGAGQTISDIQHDAQDRLTKYGNTTYYHDANGERSQKTALGQGTTKYTWDVFGNLRSVTLPNQAVVEYIIDGGNRRVGKKVNGALSKAWLYDGPMPAAELDPGQAVVAPFVYATKGHVPDYMVKNGSTYRLVTDQVGSVRLVLDVQTGEVKQRIDYDDFGRVLADSNPGLQPFGFAGGLYDPDTGLVRFGARDYDAETGRWLAKDPILFAGGDTNLYGYTANDPVNAIDPDGLALQNAAMASALNDGLLSWLGFGTLAQGLRNRADGMLAMSNDASFALGLAKYRLGTCQIGAGTMEAAGRMQMIAGAITIAATLGAAFASRGGAMAGRRLGHTFTKHGSENTEQLLRQAAGSGKPVGQWLDNIAAERFIADRIGQLGNGAKTFDLPEGLGRVIHPDGTFSVATKARLVPSGSGVKTAYPLIE